MFQNRDKRKALIATLIIYGLVAGALFMLALRTPLPLPEEMGVEVNLGNSDDGTGDIQPHELAAGQATPAAPQPAPTVDEDAISVPDETPAIKPVVKPKPQPVPTTRPATTAKPQPATPPQQVVNPRAMYKGSTGTGTTGGDQGTTGRPGDQGKPTGSPDATGYTGSGGTGTSGVSFDLSGRSSRSIPRPPSTFRETGIVVVTIFVNRDGVVTRVIPGAKGTTTSSSELRRLAENAAKNARFSAKPDAPEEQRGTITYIFELN